MDHRRLPVTQGHPELLEVAGSASLTTETRTRKAPPMSNRLRLLIGAVLSVIGLTLGSTVASADVCPSCNGGLVVNQSTSSHLLLIWNGSQTASIYPGQTSERFTSWQDVDMFQSPYCPAQRYQNGLWTTVYKTGVWYAVGDYDSLSVRVSWC